MWSASCLCVLKHNKLLMFQPETMRLLTLAFILPKSIPISKAAPGAAYTSHTLYLHGLQTNSYLNPAQKHHSTSQVVYCQGFSLTFHKVDLKEAACTNLTLAFWKCFSFIIFLQMRNVSLRPVFGDWNKLWTASFRIILLWSEAIKETSALILFWEHKYMLLNAVQDISTNFYILKNLDFGILFSLRFSNFWTPK